jgi:hypothetical protein
MEWPKWLIKRIIKEQVEVKIVPYYFTVEAEQYRETIQHLEKLLRAAEEARKVAEQAARKNLYPDEEFARALKALRVLLRIKMEIDQWTAS